MSTTRIALSAMALVLFAASASAQTKTIAPKPQIEVSNAAIGSLECGKVISRTITVKNTGTAALSTKLVINGNATPFTLAAGEEKAITAGGGTYDCKASVVVKASIPNPYATGTIAAPLWSRDYVPNKVSYDSAVVGGVTVAMTTANCGAKPVMKFTNEGAVVGVKALLPGGSVGGTVAPGTSQTYTGPTDLVCDGAAPLMRYAVGNTPIGELAPTKVGF